MRLFTVLLGVIAAALLSPAVFAQVPAEPVSVIHSSQTTGVTGYVGFIKQSSQLGLLAGGEYSVDGISYGMSVVSIGDTIVANVGVGNGHEAYRITEYAESGANLYATTTHIQSGVECYAFLPKSGGTWQDFNFPTHPGVMADYFSLGGEIHLITEDGEIYVLDENSMSLDFAGSVHVDHGLSQDLIAYELGGNFAAIAKKGASRSFYLLEKSGQDLFINEINTYASRGFEINDAKILASDASGVFVAARCWASNPNVLPGNGIYFGDLFTAIVRFDRDASKSDADRIQFLALGSLGDLFDVVIEPAENGHLVFLPGMSELAFSLTSKYDMTFNGWDETTLDILTPGWYFASSSDSVVWEELHPNVELYGHVTDAHYEDSTLLFSIDASDPGNPAVYIPDGNGGYTPMTSSLGEIRWGTGSQDSVIVNPPDTTVVPPDTSGNDTVTTGIWSTPEDKQDISIYSPTGYSEIVIENNSSGSLSYYVFDLSGRTLTYGDVGIGRHILNFDGTTPVAVVTTVDRQGNRMTRKVLLR